MSPLPHRTPPSEPERTGTPPPAPEPPLSSPAAPVRVERGDDLESVKARVQTTLERVERAEPDCPLCGGVLTPHGDANPLKAGAKHCDACGSCWAAGLRHQREGHPAPVLPGGVP